MKLLHRCKFFYGSPENLLYYVLIYCRSNKIREKFLKSYLLLKKKKKEESDDFTSASVILSLSGRTLKFDSTLHQ